MTLSELLEMSPLGWELLKKETLKYRGLKGWDYCVSEDSNIMCLFMFELSPFCEMWVDLSCGDTTLLKQWEAKQISK